MPNARKAPNNPGARPLRAATPEDAPVKPLTLAEAVESGDYLAILVAQRREIALSLPNEKGPAKAALHRQLSAIAKEIEGLNAKSATEANEDAELSGEQDWDASVI